MKKIYLSATALLASVLLNAQSFTWDVVPYKGAFPVTDNTPATNWTSGWTEWNPEAKVYATPTQTVTGNISTNTTWSGVVYLDGFVHVINNAELTILPGTVIRGKQTDVTVTPGVLVIARGSKIHAVGTPTNPIVFTSIKPANSGRAYGDWGGVVLCGNARVNLHTLTTPRGAFNEMKVEGFVTDEPNGYRHFGGNNDADNSGEISYCRIEFAGVSLNPSILNNEINGLTLGGVGSGTKLDHIQVSFSGDDSFEWFGGTVNAKYLIANRGKDDDFDTDNGFSGKVQFGLAIKDPYIADDSDPTYASNGFECDNNGVGSYFGLPVTKAIFSNMTMVGPYGDGTAYGDVAGVNTHHKAAAHLRRNMAQSVYNTLFVGWAQGLRYQQASTLDNITSTNADSSCAFKTNVITDVAATAGTLTINQATFVNDGTVFTQAWYHTYAAANNIDTTTTASQINFVNAFTQLGNVPDYRLNASSVAANGADFSGLCNTIPTATLASLGTTCVNSPTLVLTGGLPTGGTYSGIAVSSNVFNPSLAGVGNYTITYTYSNTNCSASAINTISVSACVGINEFEKELGNITMFPNPTENNTSVIINSSINSIVSISIYDYTGKLIYTPVQNATLIEGKNEITIKTDNLSNGIYLVNINTTFGKETKKLIITK